MVHIILCTSTYATFVMFRNSQFSSSGHQNSADSLIKYSLTHTVFRLFLLHFGVCIMVCTVLSTFFEVNLVPSY